MHAIMHTTAPTLPPVDRSPSTSTHLHAFKLPTTGNTTCMSRAANQPYRHLHAASHLHFQTQAQLTEAFQGH